MFQVGFYLLPGTELWPVSFNKRQQNKEAFFQKYSWRAARMFSQCFPVCPTGSIVPSVTVAVFQFPRCKLYLRCTVGNFNENLSFRGLRAIAKIWRARPSEHSWSNFWEQFEQRPNFASMHFQIEWDHSIPLVTVSDLSHVTISVLISDKPWLFQWPILSV